MTNNKDFNNFIIKLFEDNQDLEITWEQYYLSSEEDDFDIKFTRTPPIINKCNDLLHSEITSKLDTFNFNFFLEEFGNYSKITINKESITIKDQIPF